MRRLSFFLAAMLLCGQAPATSFKQAHAQSARTQTANGYAQQILAFENFVKQQMADEKTPGLSVGFIKGDFMWTKAYGFADLENRSPAKPESSYRLASVTKPMTAAAILQLAERGKINLDSEVQTYVPYFPKKKWPVTVRQLLGHLGGISHYQNVAEQQIKEHKTTREAIAIFENFDLVAEPGTGYYYTSYGYNLLGAVIESASGQSFAQYMRDNVWQPLGMNDTRMDDPTEIIPNRVRGYRLIYNQVRNSEFVDISSRFAAGGTRSTVVDMLKFGQGFLEGKLLTKASVEQMLNSMETRDGQLTDYGMGWDVSPRNGQFVITHNGGQQETSTALYVFPAKGIVIAAASNLEDANTDLYARRLFEFLTGEAYEVEVYIGSQGDRSPTYKAMQAVFDSGRSHFYRHRKAFTRDDRELAESFAYFNQALDDPKWQESWNAVMKKVSEGRSVSTKQPFVKVGSFMAERLNQKLGPGAIDAYSNTGAIKFFNDYIELYKKDAGIAKELRFSEGLEKTVSAWQQSWAKTNAADGGRFAINASTDLDALGSRLRGSFAGEEAYPNWSQEMLRAMQQFALDGKVEKSLKVGALIPDLYPRLENPSTFHGVYGVVLVVSGDREKGVQYLRRAYERNANGVAAPARLTRLAYIFAETGATDAGLAVLQAGAEMHPKAASLHYHAGELYLKKGMKEKAVESYKKALEINPGFPNAEDAKATLKKLEN